MSTKPSLIVRLPNWLGDVMMTLPSLQALHALGIELHLFGKRWIFDLLKEDHFYLHEYPSNDFRAVKDYRKIKSNYLLLFTNSLSSALTGKLAGKKLVGFKSDMRSCLLQYGLKKKQGLHEVQYFWELSKFAIQNFYPEFTWPTHLPDQLNLSLPAGSDEKALSLLEKSKIQGNYWVICPLAKGKGEQGQPKIWPYWKSLYQKINEANITAIACPGPGEEDLLQKMIPTIKTLPNLSLSEYAAILKYSQKVIANDSGPMHLATAVGANVLGIFGTTDPNRTYPWGGQWIGSKNQWPSLETTIEQLKPYFFL